MLTEKDKDRLLAVGRQRAAVEYAREKLKGCVYGLRAVKADGMPHGSTSADGIPNAIAQKEKAEKALRREEARLSRVVEEARRVIMRQPPPMIRFCLLRYIDGYGMKEIKRRLWNVPGCSERSLDRMKRKIEG